jgi:opacity protein-like surface antigen
MRIRPFVIALTLLVTLVGRPAAAAADTYLSPFVGLTFAGDAKEKAPVYGAAISLLGRAAGVEVEFGYSPNFFGEGSDANVTTLMAAFQVGGNTMGQGVKPYALVGAGLVRTRIDNEDLVEDVEFNDFGLSIGAGVNAFFTPNVGIRGDVRYIRALEAPGEDGIPIASNFDFWRAIVAASFRF